MTSRLNCHRIATFVLTAGVVVFGLLLGDAARGQFGGGGSGGGGMGGGMGRGGGGRHGSSESKSDSSESRSSYTPSPATLMPHAGDYVSTETNYFEIVYMPFQTRIYWYDKNFKPLSARDLHAQMTLQFPLEPAPRQIVFHFVPSSAVSTEQDYVAAALDIRPLQDKDISITVEFSGLTGRSNPTAAFTPHYDHFAIRPYVAQAALTDGDRDAVARQRVCPVTGAPLGSRGQIVKLYVTDIPLYVCGEDCIATVKESPRKFVPQAPPPPDPAR